MRIVINERKVKRNRQIAQYLFFFSLIVLIGGLILSNNTTFMTQNSLTLFVPFILLPLALVTTLVSVRLTNEYVKLPHPEDALRDGLKGINRRSILYNYVLPAEHVLVTPQGVYSIVSRFQETRFKIEGGKWKNYKARGPLGPLFLFLKQENLRNPFKQCDEEADYIQKLVDQALPNSEILVQPAVVFTSDKATLEVVNPEIPVVYANPKKRPSLKGLLKEEREEIQKSQQGKDKKDKKPQKAQPETPAVLSEDQIERLHETFLASLKPNQRAGIVESET